MTTINVRVEKKTKVRAAKTFAKLGLDMSSAVKLFLHQVVYEDGLPFTPTQNPATVRARWDKEAEEALKSPGYKTAQDLHKAILKK
jgi:DNA-damage-inducible protein J